MKEVPQTGLALKKGGELGFGAFEGSKSFRSQENGVGVMVWVIRDEFDGVQEFIRHLDGEEVFGAGKNEVFFAMIEAGDMFEHQAFEFIEQVAERPVWVRLYILGQEKVEKGFSGEAFGIVTVGQDAAVRTAPAEALNLVLGEAKGLVKEEFPVLLPARHDEMRAGFGPEVGADFGIVLCRAVGERQKDKEKERYFNAGSGKFWPRNVWLWPIVE